MSLTTVLALSAALHLYIGARIVPVLPWPAGLAFGLLLLASNLGYLPRLGPLFHQWWPLILVIIGVALLVRR